VIASVPTTNSALLAILKRFEKGLTMEYHQKLAIFLFTNFSEGLNHGLESSITQKELQTAPYKTYKQ